MDIATPGFTMNVDNSPAERLGSLVVECTFESASPQTLFAHFTDPGLLTTWWSGAAETNLVQGGSYHLSWPQQGWNLRGTYTQVNPDSELAFTWAWDHVPPRPDGPLEVRIEFMQNGRGSTHMVLTHGPYNADDSELRASHLDGWTHFLAKLATVVATA